MSVTSPQRQKSIRRSFTHSIVDTVCELGEFQSRFQSHWRMHSVGLAELWEGSIVQGVGTRVQQTRKGK